MINFKREDFIQYYYEILGNSYQVWYHSLPAVFAFFAVVLSLNNYKLMDVSIKPLEIGFLVATTIFAIHCTNHPELETAKKLLEVENYVDYSSNQYVKVPISPDFVDWACIVVPVNDEYCEKNECITDY